MTAVYLDACMVIYLVEGERIHQDLLVRQMRGKRIVTSELVRLEARIKAIRENARHHLTVYDDYFEKCQWVLFDRGLFERATQLRVDYRLKTPDALHLAAALTSCCDEFWTNDQHLADAAGGLIKVVDWKTLTSLS